MIMSRLASHNTHERLLTVQSKESFMTLFIPLLTSWGILLLNKFLIRLSYKSSNVQTSWPTCKSMSSRFTGFYFLGIFLFSQILNYTIDGSPIKELQNFLIFVRFTV